MGPIKKTFIIFISSVVSFFLLASITEYKDAKQSITLLLKSFNTEETNEPIEEEKIIQILNLFNKHLAGAYLKQDGALLNSLPIERSLKQRFLNEIEFLKKSGKIMKIQNKEIKITKLARLSNILIGIKTLEKKGIEYLNSKNNTVVTPYEEKNYNMVYTIEFTSKKWKIMSMEPDEKK